MDKLSPARFGKILKAIEILDQDLDYGRVPERILDAVLTVVEVDLASYNEVDPASGRARFVLRPDIREMAQGSREYGAFARRFGHHPIVAQRVSRMAEANLSDFVRRLRTLGMVGNCCGQAELRLNLGLSIAASPSLFVGIAIHRGIRDFDADDAAGINLLRPHIVSAYRNARRIAEAEGNLAKSIGPVGDPPLTRRESEVLYWVSMGKTNDEVSEIIGAKPLTIKKHLEHIYDKLGVPNRTAAARMSRIPAGV